MMMMMITIIIIIIIITIVLHLGTSQFTEVLFWVVDGERVNYTKQVLIKGEWYGFNQAIRLSKLCVVLVQKKDKSFAMFDTALITKFQNRNTQDFPLQVNAALIWRQHKARDVRVLELDPNNKKQQAKNNNNGANALTDAAAATVAAAETKAITDATAAAGQAHSKAKQANTNNNGANAVTAAAAAVAAAGAKAINDAAAVQAKNKAKQANNNNNNNGTTNTNTEKISNKKKNKQRLSEPIKIDNAAQNQVPASGNLFASSVLLLLPLLLAPQGALATGSKMSPAQGKEPCLYL
jgi:hypothetical protein